MSEPPPRRGLNGGPPDLRNAVLLVDEERRAFLANVSPEAFASFGAMYKHFGEWKAHDEAVAEDLEKNGDKVAAARFRERAQSWEWFIGYLDRLLVLSGSVNGRRAAQLVTAITREQGARASPDVMFQVTGQQAQAQQPVKKGFFGGRK